MGEMECAMATQEGGEECSRREDFGRQNAKPSAVGYINCPDKWREGSSTHQLQGLWETNMVSRGRYTRQDAMPLDPGVEKGFSQS